MVVVDAIIEGLETDDVDADDVEQKDWFSMKEVWEGGVEV
jgi:hypothetical protein